MIGFIPTLPFYEVKKGLVTERKTMRMEMQPQSIKLSRLRFICDGIANTKSLFEELSNYPSILNSIPDAQGRNITLFNEANRNNIIYPPTSSLSRIDVINGKIVDLNTKPAGFGLITSAELIWQKENVYQEKTQPITADYNNLLPEEFEKAVIVTESTYPFVTDQIAIAKIAERQTDKHWRIIYCNQTKPDIKDGEAVFCFSWLSSPSISPTWIKFLFANQEQFLLNPLAARWDNKALMALPFLENDLPSGNLSTLLRKISKMFPDTYLFRRNGNSLEMAVGIGVEGIEYQKVNKFNAPATGDLYLKPLLESGARGIIVKKLTDSGTSKSTLLEYSERYHAFIAQEKVHPQLEEGFNIKDGYFVQFNNPFNLLTIERMGVKTETNLIHGGSSSLIPLSIPYLET
ncbi:MAG: hypothetical protein US60_C0009G0018 [Microgenomates group bacterium GW2011_GWC1_37_8]|uniref:Uncharacterized protein n=1 Tax=Candidatus Woesebacteria bacterium GW2011_GWB1_38_8 TaxID=1618570 RepID=A0A0G0L4I8_9BACT|nr:MAG: hypothetical protein US60_C0009G0018 [Microgenomates group bacterium GW2011_GWC1_37_8]KKQ85937.1 MAG: hypothetical protein UT08_C0003G0100 [Candidatus Woesebacteria bacterium GW2011_GWB1_38_8]